MDEVYKETNAIVAITVGYRYQGRGRAPIDAGKLVADNGKIGDYRYISIGTHHSSLNRT